MEGGEGQPSGVATAKGGFLNRIKTAGETLFHRRPEPDLTRITFSQGETRTEGEIREGMPRFVNESILTVELDTKLFVDILREEGLTNNEISELKVVFKSPAFPESHDLHGSMIGGRGGGVRPRVEVFTTFPFIFHEAGARPDVLSGRASYYMVAAKPELVANTLLHESKHYVQSKRGVFAGNSWAARSAKEHDEIPSEREANEFAGSKTQRFKGRIKVWDPSGRFQPAAEVIFKNEEYKRGKLAVTGPVGYDTPIARFFEDSPRVSRALEYMNAYQKIIVNPGVDRLEVFDFLKEGRRLFDEGVIAACEMNALFTKVSAMAKEAKRDDIEVTAKNWMIDMVV